MGGRHRGADVAMPGYEAQNTAAVVDEVAHQIAEAVLAGVAGDLRQRRGQVGIAGGPDDGLVLRGGEQVGGVAFAQHVEVRRDTGLHREAAQHGFAKRVDGHDAQAAGGIDDAGEQLSGDGAQRRGNRHAAGDGRQVLVEGAIVGGGPGTQRVADPDAHFRRRGLGEGQAQNAQGVGAAQQQAEEAVDQYLGLAGAGGRADPYTRLRVGGFGLAFGGDGDGVDGHGPDHSLTRAR